jgi:hypothetical protein
VPDGPTAGIAEPASGNRRQAHMTQLLRPAIVLVVVAVLLTACSSGAASSAPSEQPAPSEAVAPGQPVETGEPGIGQPDGGPELVQPEAGQQNVHPVAIERMEATASGTTVSVDATWTSGVDPCYVLDHIEVHDTDNRTAEVTLFEGTSDPDAICVMMAVTKHTIFSFDVPETGTWTIRDTQDGTPPIEVAVS